MEAIHYTYDVAESKIDKYPRDVEYYDKPHHAETEGENFMSQRTLRKALMGNVYYFSALITPTRRSAVLDRLPCAATLITQPAPEYLEIWLSCSDRSSVIRTVGNLYDSLGPVLKIGFLDGTSVELPIFLRNTERALRYYVIDGTVVLECLRARICLDLSELKFTKVVWRASSPNKVRVEVVSLETVTTFLRGMRIVKPWVIPPKLT